MMKKQTAVEWICEQWLYLDMMLIDKKIYWEKLRELQVKAKKMEKQQILDANDSGFTDGVTDRDDGIMRFKTAEQYYNETYSK
jgi:hypothetical protein